MTDLVTEEVGGAYVPFHLQLSLFISAPTRSLCHRQGHRKVKWFAPG